MAIADLLLGHRVPAPSHAFSHALHPELDRDDDDVQVHQVAGVSGIRDEPDLARV